MLTVTVWGSPGQLAALREQLAAWPLSLNHTAVRVVLAVGPEHDVVIVQTHHAAFDGISSLALLSAICAGYRDATGAGSGPVTASPSLPGFSQALPGSSQVQAAPYRSSHGRPRRPVAAATGPACHGCPAP